LQSLKLFGHTSASPRRMSPGLCLHCPPRRAWGTPGARCARSLAWDESETTRVSHHRFTGITRRSRTRMVLTVSFVLSPVIGLVCHRRLRKCPQVRCRRRGIGTTRLRRPRRRRSSSGAARVHRIPRPTSVTIAKRPFERARDAANIAVIWGRREAVYFRPQVWTGQISLRLQQNFLFWRKGA
jgi:hypothetical protein